MTMTMTKSQRRDYMQRKAEMVNKMVDISDSVFHYIDKYSPDQNKNTNDQSNSDANPNLAKAISDIYYGKPYHVPLNQCVFPGTNEIDWDRAEENLRILQSKLSLIRELCE